MPSGLKSDDDDIALGIINTHVLMFKIEIQKYDYFIEK